MTKRIIYKNTDGTCGILIPSPHWQGTIEELAIKDVPKGLEWRVADCESIPVDRTFRNAWTDNNPTETVDVDMVKATNIHIDNLREKRKERFSELDTQMTRALEEENADKKAEILATKNALRDFPTSTDFTASTPEELLKIIPIELR